jgi:hypothetical protein
MGEEEKELRCEACGRMIKPERDEKVERVTDADGVVRAGDQSREGRAISPRVAEEWRNKDVLHAAYVRARRAGGRRGRRAGECVTPRNREP